MRGLLAVASTTPGTPRGSCWLALYRVDDILDVVAGMVAGSATCDSSTVEGHAPEDEPPAASTDLKRSGPQ